MLVIKSNKISDLPTLGFRLGRKYYTHEEQNVKINATTGEIGIIGQGASYALRVPNIILALCLQNFIEEV